MPKTAPPHGPATHGEGHDDHACHSANASTHHINWYQGLLGVKNDKALRGSALDKLLYRYYNPANECDEKNQEPPVLGSLINLAIVLYILVRFGGKPINESLAKRKKTIMQDIDAATALLVDAEKRLKTYESRLSKIEAQKKELKEDSAKQWEIEKARILREAEDKAARMRRDAEFRVAQELKQSQADLLREAVDGAVAAAEALVKNKIQASDQDRLADEYLVGIGKALNQNERRVS